MTQFLHLSLARILWAIAKSKTYYTKTLNTQQEKKIYEILKFCENNCQKHNKNVEEILRCENKELGY